MGPQSYKGLDILCLQELIVDAEIVKFQLNSIFPGGLIVTNTAQNGRVNFAIVFASHINVLGPGKKGDGLMSWVMVESSSSPINVASLYSPTKKEERVEFWRWVEQRDPDE